MTIWACLGILWLNKGCVVLLILFSLILKHDKEGELVIEEDNLFQLWIEDIANDLLYGSLLEVGYFNWTGLAAVRVLYLCWVW